MFVLVASVMKSVLHLESNVFHLAAIRCPLELNADRVAWGKEQTYTLAFANFNNAASFYKSDDHEAYRRQQQYSPGIAPFMAAW